MWLYFHRKNVGQSFEMLQRQQQRDMIQVNGVKKD
jgi:hypothetical protein